MALAQSSRFLYFLIIGALVFPNGSLTGLAYAKPLGEAADTDIIQLQTIREYLQNIYHGASKQPEGVKGRTLIPVYDIHYEHGARSDMINSSIYLKNVTGPLIFGATSVMESNNIQD